MKIRWYKNFLGIVTLLVLGILGLVYDNTAVTAQQNTDKIEAFLLDQFSTQGAADFIVRFTDQADLSFAYSMSWQERGNFVVDQLTETAQRNQINAIGILDSQGFRYQTFIAGNELYVFGGNLDTADTLSALPEVSFIRGTRTYYIDPIVEVKPFENITWAGDLLANQILTTVASSIDALDWGISDTKANQFWTTFGVQGEGIVVANIDTGVQWNHPALAQAFKCGTNPSDPACWRDPANICGGSACDNNGHGTHTMGTMVADDNPSLSFIAGMAPKAKWIACKGCESNQCSDFALNTCADWILAPNGNPANRPNVVNNSWGGFGGDDWYQAKVQAWVAAGIFPAFSAGNSGSGCSTLGSPGDYQESFGSAAHDSSRNIASFSSRGPSVYGHTPYNKPNISAPGVNICSTVPGNGWNCSYSGTSMASPHTAGAVALLWSCNPSLVGQIDLTFQLLQNNTDTAPAGNCGAPLDGEGNYTYGYGYLDVLAAGNDACGGRIGKWTQITLPSGCPDWTRFDGEYYPGTGLVYFMGGRGGPSGSETFGDVISYNPTSNTCTDTGTDLPFPISNYTINLVNNGVADVLCTFGGRGAAGTNILNVQCYNPITNNASSVTTLPAVYSGYTPGAQVVVDSMVYIIGGFRNTLAPYELANTYMYNPVLNSFFAKGNLSLARSYLDVAPVDGLIYAFGGTVYDGSTLNAQTRAEVFTPGTGLWNDAAIADLPTATAEGRAYGFDSSSNNTLAGKIVIAAGGQFPGESLEAFTYDIASNTYNYEFPDLNVSRRDNAGFFIPGNPGAIWVFGGRSGGDIPPYGVPEYYQDWQLKFLPMTYK